MAAGNDGKVEMAEVDADLQLLGQHLWPTKKKKKGKKTRGQTTKTLFGVNTVKLHS